MPFPLVPEVSLIMDKPRQPNLSNSIPELRNIAARDAAYKGESYAAWKEKQFSRHSQGTPPNRLHQIYSSTHNSSGLQDSYWHRQSSASCNSLDCKDPNCKNQSSGDESPRRYSLPKRSGQIEKQNKYTTSHAMSNNEINHHAHNSYNYSSSPHSRSEGGSPNTRRHSDHSHHVEAHNVRQKPRIHRSSSYSNADSYPHRTVPTEHAYHLKQFRSLTPVEHEYHPKHSRSLPHHSSPEDSHHYSDYCPVNHSASNTETGTVNSLLKIITGQSEQIKSLQKQVERLLKLHEQTLKDQNRCTCQSNGIIYQNKQTYDQSRTVNVPVVYDQSRAAKMHNNLIKDNERCFSDSKPQDEKNKQTIVEQKVSIGVMTSFEWKVQNNPSLAAENESRQKNNQERILPSLETSNIIKNLVNDTGEMIRKKPNAFNPHVLENISEGSESHLSSFRQSHVCSDTTRQSIEAQDSIEVQHPNFCNPNYQVNVNVQTNSESRKNMNTSGDKALKTTAKRDYELKEQMHERIDTDLQDNAYRYNRSYGDSRSSPHENANEKQSDDFNAEPLMPGITKTKNVRRDNFADECLSLSSSEIDVEDASPPSPEPDIQIDMQEYSSEGGSLPPQNKGGWTMYNNVCNQIEQIFQNTVDPEQEVTDGMSINEREEYDNNVILDTVQAARLDHLTKQFGINFSDNVDQREPNYNKKYVSFHIIMLLYY